MENNQEKKYCKFCGAQIPFDAVVCTNCGRQVEDIKSAEKPIIINNSAAASSSATSIQPGRRKKHYSLFWDIVLTCFTGGLWLIWVLIRPKYEY